MAWRLYIVPVVGVGTKADPRRPKYFSDGTITSQPGWGFVDYGFEPWFVVGADLNAADDATVIAKADAFGLPVDLTPLLTAANVTTVQTKLAAANIPAQWVTTSLTWTQMIRVVLGMCFYMQRFGLTYATTNGTVPGSIFGGTITLDSTFGTLSAAIQAAMISAATSFGFSTASLVSGTTIRVILKTLADNFANQVYNFAGHLI